MPANVLFFKTSATENLGNNAEGRVVFTVDNKQEVWADAYLRYGVSFDSSALSRIMTPAPNKGIVENKSDLQHGKRVYRDSDDVRKDERNVSITMNITARTEELFYQRYQRFCSEILDNGFIDIRISYLPSEVFRMTYLDCQQFSEFRMSIGKFQLSLNEPDPTNRGEVDNWESE